MKKKIRKIYIVIIEVIILVLLLVFFFIKKQGAPGSLDTGIKITDFLSNYIEYDNGWHIGPENFNCDSDTIDMLYGPFSTLPKGDYTIVFGYSCDEKQSAKPYATGENINYIKANTIDLYPYYHSISYDFRITEPINDFEVRVYYNGIGNMEINDIKIYGNLNPWKRSIFIIIILFVFVDIIIFNYDLILRNNKEIAYLTSIVLLLSLPLFIEGVVYFLDGPGLDTEYHLMRVEGICLELRRGIFPVRMHSDWLYGNGYPASIYYADLLLYIPATMRLMGFTVTQAYKSYILFINVLTVCISYFSFKVIVKDKMISILMTLAYCTATYRIMTVVFRDALGEYTATAFIPMVAASIFLIYTDESDLRKPDIQKASLLALAMSGIVLSHHLSTEMVTVVIFIFCIINIRKTIQVRTFLTFGFAVLETVLLSMYFLVPFLDYYLNVDVISTHGVNDKVLQIQDTGASLLELFLFYKDEWCNSPGALLMAVLIFSIFFVILGKTDRRVKIMLLMSIITLFLASNLCPWDWLAYHSKIWNALSVIEFPNRYLTIADVLLVILMGFLLLPLWTDGTKKFRINVTAVVILLSVSAAIVSYHYFEKNGITHNCIDSADVRTDATYSGDFSRVDENGEPIVYIRPEVEAENAVSETISHKGSTMELHVKTMDVPGMIKTPYFNYKGYRAIDTEGNEFPIADDEYCKVSFVVPASYDGIIKVSFIEPWYWRASEIVSLVAWIGLIVFFVSCQLLHKQIDEG